MSYFNGCQSSRDLSAFPSVSQTTFNSLKTLSLIASWPPVSMSQTVVCMVVCSYVYTFVWLYVCMFVCLYVCMFVCLYARIFVCLCVCVFVCLYVFLCMYFSYYTHDNNLDRL